VCRQVRFALPSRQLFKNLILKRPLQNCNLPYALYGYETLSLTLKEERGLSVLENRVLRRIFGPEREEVAGGWRK
jgi:hypothetical protein